MVSSRALSAGLVLAVVLVLLLPGAVPSGAAGLNQGVAPIDLARLLPEARFDAETPTVEQVTGVALGRRPLRPEEALAYFQALAEHSPRARLIEYARSHEDRPLVVLAIADEATIARLDAFQAEHAALLDPRLGGVPAAADLAGVKAVAWLAYGIHGDELSSTDAAVAVAYWLVAGVDEGARRLRDRLVVFLDPSENPDGRGRYLAQTLSFAHRTANPDQDDLSHRAVWPWGRGNHYLFDLNRDWFTMLNPESARTELVARWLPQLLVDSHEMGSNSSYLFPPARHPFNPHLPPNARQWELSFSADQAAALDGRGYPYFSGEWNEEFFPGYGSSLARFHGSVGILYEMGRTSGTLVRQKGGTLRTYAQAVEHQVASSVANLTTLADNRAAVLRDMIAARQEAVVRGSKDKVKAWVFPPDALHPERTVELVSLLRRQGVEVAGLLDDGVKARNLRDARTGEPAELVLGRGTWLVRLDQPAGYLARALLDPHVAMDAEFFREEREYLEQGKGSRLYETTAWALPLIRGVPAFWADSLPGGRWSAAAAVPEAPAGMVPTEFSSLILDYAPDAGPRVLADLLQAGVNVRVAEKPFTIDGHRFGRGALVIRREANPDDLGARLEPIARRHAVDLVPVHTSRSSDGPDLGGDHFPVLVEPRVGVLAGMPVSPTEYGAVWHLLDQELDLRFSAIDVSRLGRTDLSRYNVLVFPPVMGGAAMYRQTIGPGGLERLRQWLEAGGTAIGFAGGAEMLADEKTDLTAARFRSQVLKNHPSPVWSISAPEARAAGRIQATGLKVAAVAGGPEAGPPVVAPHGSLHDVAPVLGPGALPFVQERDQGLALRTPPVPMAEWVKPVLPAGRNAADETDLAAADARLRRFMPQGALLRVRLDPEYWLNFGLADEVTVWFGGEDTLVASDPVTVAALFPEVELLHLGGLLWPEAAARMAETAYATRESVGKGQVVLFAANPVFRRWMKDTERMFTNAVLLGPGLGARWPTPW